LNRRLLSLTSRHINRNRCGFEDNRQLQKHSAKVALGNWANESFFGEGVASGRPEGNGNGFSVVIELASGAISKRLEAC
jgi:hypothetical protein